MGGRWRRRPAWDAVVILVLVVPALAAGCTIRARPEAPSTAPLVGGPTTTAAAPTTTVGTVRGTTVARRAFLLDLGAPGNPVRAAPDGPLRLAFRRRSQELGYDRPVSLVLVFPLLRSRPGCVRQVQLWLRVLRFDDPQPELAAYPSLLASWISDQPLPPIGSETLIDNRPRGTGTLTAGGTWMQFDITALYRTWAGGGPFPSQGRAVEPGTPLVVDVRPSVVTEPYFEARFAGLGGDRHTAPQLRWRVTPGC